MYDTKDRSRLCPHPIQRDCTRRAVFVDYGCTLYSWPSSGGVIIKDNANGVEMVFLGLDRFNPPSERFEDAEAEDAFGRELRKIGGKRWKSEQRYLDAYFAEGNGTKLTEAELKVNIYGWPDNGGLWVLHYPTEEDVPNDIARLNMAFTMEERCQLLKEYNAKFYENPRDYGGLADVFTDEENQAEL